VRARGDLEVIVSSRATAVDDLSVNGDNGAPRVSELVLLISLASEVELT
jgi:hypothetical protein